ncbi:hypothetical protein NJT12_02890 [Flavobacterium sp. AC]|uniref:GLPGLI family protein n=1 Tax=Flavobacterium azizsancarii TaxID=2961580 RepID=A0ABT4W7P2_9FLAO|nr:hypothetical protein [Flavobacterium azizsancarii]MDA6068557.1 hypothetical protein [Flavobacterium azizsancarii]
MKKLFLLLIFFATGFLFAQVKTNESISFSNNNTIANFQFSKYDDYSVDYQKYINSPVQFSIYNPKPGFNPIKIESQKYYSFTNTNLLLRRQMSNQEREPIYPDQKKEKTFGEAILHDVLDAVFDKKSK